jgi:hypothetical protein
MLKDAEEPLRWQFSVRQLMITMVVASIALAVLFGFPGWFASATIIAAATLLLAVLAAAAIFGQGDLRAFCVGALCPALLVAVATTTLFVIVCFDLPQSGFSEMIQSLARYAGGMRLAILTSWPLAIAAGILSVAVRRWLMQTQDGE